MVVAVRGFTFDLEGTMVDLELAHHLGHLAAAQELGLTLSLEEAREIIPSFVGGPDATVAAQLRDLSGKNVPAEHVLARSRYHYAKLRENVPVRPRPGVQRFLGEVSRSGYKIALGSVTSRDEGRALLEASGLADYFRNRVQVFLEDVRSPKPAPDVYLETAKRNEIDPAEQLVFDDSPSGVESARAAGSIAVAMPTVDSQVIRRALREAGAIATFEDWGQLTLDRILQLTNNI